MSHRHRRHLITAVAVLVLASASAGDALAPDVLLDAAATPSAAAESVFHRPDLVSIYQTGAMSATNRDAALAAAQQAGAPAALLRGFTIGLTRVRRGTDVIQVSTGPGWAFPMSVTAMPLDAIGAVMGRNISAPISQGKVVLGELTASLRGAKAGDTIDLVAADGSIKTFTVGLVAPAASVGGTEIVMSTTQADVLGAVYDTEVLVYGQFSRSALSTALAARGVSTNSRIRIRRSWDEFDPDLTLGMAKTKQLLGEFDYYYAGLTTSGYTTMNPVWKAASLPVNREMYSLTPGVPEGPGILARCHVAVQADLRAALDEVAATYPQLINWDEPGVDELYDATTGIDIENTNLAGGCSTGMVRFARITQNLGSISRHSWGQPIDMSTVANCQGCKPIMDCRIVRIFRSHNFAWGGNFLTPDGMHFEWVGEPRNGFVDYPTKYCPNLPGGAIESRRATPDGHDTFFADDGWALSPDG